MKKIISIFASIAFLLPAAAFAADDFTISPSSYYDPGTDGVLNNSLIVNQAVLYTSNNTCNEIIVPALSGGPTGTFSGWTTFTPMVYDQTYTGNPLPTSFHIVTMASSFSSCSDAPATYSDALADPTFISDQEIDLLLPLPPDTSIEHAISVATSSFAQSYGFDLDQATSWMWDNLGQPILGSGIGTLVVMRWYWLGFIAFGIVILFAFYYFRFFKK